MMLTDKEYWEKKYKPDKKKGGGNLWRRLLSEHGTSFVFHFSKYQLWHMILNKLLPKNAAFKVLEIGSAPGDNLVNIHKFFGYQPFGIEYTKKGVLNNQLKFSENGLNPQNIIEADFLSDHTINKYKNQFDVVMSFGFIEHFDCPEMIVSRHLELVRPGGFIIINIPNLKGLNYYIAQCFDESALRVHNLSIMNMDSFSNLFKNRIDALYCGYYGIFNFSLFNTNSKAKQLILTGLKCIQVLLNLFFTILPSNDLGRRNGLLSPYLLFVGKKRSNSDN